MFFGIALLVGGWGFVGWCVKSYLGPAEISSFSSRDLSRRNKHDSFWLVVSTGYFYILFLWVIVFSDFLPLEIHKYLVLPLASITFTANSQADKCISISTNVFICPKYYTAWNRIHVKVSYIHVWFKCENGLQKKLFIEKNRFFSGDYLKINELHVVHTWRHVQSE